MSSFSSLPIYGAVVNDEAIQSGVGLEVDKKENTLSLHFSFHEVCLFRNCLVFEIEMVLKKIINSFYTGNYNRTSFG